jgi:hypothetical protein
MAKSWCCVMSFRRLVYCRTYDPDAFIGFLFGLGDRNVSRSNRRLEPLPAGGLSAFPSGRSIRPPEGIKELFFESTERPTCRPVRAGGGTTTGRSGGTRSRPGWPSSGCGSGPGGAGGGE